MQNAAVPPIFNPDTMGWETRYVDLPVYRNRPILLVPKSVVRFSPAYRHGTYYQHFVLKYLQTSELANPQLGLVRIITNQKLGTQRRVVYKKDLAEHYPRTKQFLYEFSRDHPEVLRGYRQRLQELERQDTISEVDTENEFVISQALATVLRETPRGPDHASEYHSLMIGILEFIFYPKLLHPKKEQEIHQGRKRIDVVMENNANAGVFYQIPNLRRIPCAYVAIECKNYGREVGNPELDQLAGRFSVNRGKVGMLCCREFENRDLFVQRCRDTFRDDRGLIIPLEDEAVLGLLALVGDGHRDDADTEVSRLYREVSLD
jgi:hypothetical protein